MNPKFIGWSNEKLVNYFYVRLRAEIIAVSLPSIIYERMEREKLEYLITLSSLTEEVKQEIIYRMNNGSI